MDSPDNELLNQRVLVRKGPRTGRKGIINRICKDGTIRVAFPIGAGGGCEEDYYLPCDVKALGPEEELQLTEPFQTAFGPYKYRPKE